MNRFRSIVIVLLIAACAAPAQTPTLSRNPVSPATPLPDDTGWRAAGEGVETRELNVTRQRRPDRLHIARVDPSRVTFQVRYDPSQPRRVSQWLDAAPARLIVNGGFFDPNNRALGLLISDGQSFGASYEGLGGLFGVSGGHAQVRSLIAQPLRPGEEFEQMVQSFPMLLVDGAINAQMRDDGRVAPRTVVGVDQQGRVVFLVSPRSTFSLSGLAAWLAQSDLDLGAALNLDGGTSSGLIVRTPDGLWGTDSWVAVPAVIAVR